MQDFFKKGGGGGGGLIVHSTYSFYNTTLHYYTPSSEVAVVVANTVYDTGASEASRQANDHCPEDNIGDHRSDVQT